MNANMHQMGNISYLSIQENIPFRSKSQNFSSLPGILTLKFIEELKRGWWWGNLRFILNFVYLWEINVSLQ